MWHDKTGSGVVPLVFTSLITAEKMAANLAIGASRDFHIVEVWKV
jgi:hypothetical protein